MILDDGLNVMPPLGFGVAPDEEEEGVASPAPDPEGGRRDETPATAPTATTPEEAGAGTPADSDADAAETTATDTATDTTEETE